MKKIFLISLIIILSISLIFQLTVFKNAEAQTCPLCTPEDTQDIILSQNYSQLLPPSDLDIAQLRSNLNYKVSQTPITYYYTPWIDEYPYFLYNPIINPKIGELLYNIGETGYEELKCIGLYPESDTLWAIIEIKEESGYGGDLCEKGGYEYITFWIDWNGNGTYENTEYAGLTKINVHDIRYFLRCQACQSKSIHYAASLKITVPYRKCCYLPHLVKVKAILSYSVPHMNPNTYPTYGNVMVRWIQIRPAYCKIKLPQVYPVSWEPYFTQVLPFDQLPPDISIIQPEESLLPIELDLLQLTKMREKTCTQPCCELIEVPLQNLNITDDNLNFLYQCEDVEESRFEYKNIVTLFSLENGGIAGLQSLGYDTTDYIQILNPEQLSVNNTWLNTYPGLAYLWNTKYEELKCVGVKSKSNTISAVIQVKLPYGYKGNKCTKGSKEYVRFWIDWDCDGFDPNDDIGFTYVTVHDVSNIPSSGLYFAVSHRFNPKYHRPCNDINVYPARAILSWEVCPDRNPIFKYHWGNMKDSCIQLSPSDVFPLDINAVIRTIGGVTTGDLDPNGYANEDEEDDPKPACDAPFGGLVNITGVIENVPDFSNDTSCNIYSSPNVSYKLQYQKEGWPPDKWEDMEPPLGDRFHIQVQKYCNSCIPNFVCEVNNDEGWKNEVNIKDDDGYYKYYTDEFGIITQNVAGGVPQKVENILMPWDTKRLDLVDFNGDGFSDYNGDGRYKIRMKVKTGSGFKYSNTETIVIDNTLPYAEFRFTNIETCAMITKGTPIIGMFTAMDQHLLSYLLKYDCGVGCMDPGETGYIRFGAYQCDPNKNVIEYDYTVTPTIHYSTAQPVAPPFPTIPADPENYLPKPPTFEALGRYHEVFEVDTNKNIIDPCGYAVKLWVWERTIYDNVYGWKYSYMEKHLCILNPELLISEGTSNTQNTQQPSYTQQPSNTQWPFYFQWPLFSQIPGLGGLYNYRYSNVYTPMFFSNLPLTFSQIFYLPFSTGNNKLSIMQEANYGGLLSNPISSRGITGMHIPAFLNDYPYYYGNIFNYNDQFSNQILFWL